MRREPTKGCLRVESWRLASAHLAPSLRAQRSNPESLRGKILDCFAALAMTMLRQRAQTYHRHPEVRVLRRDSAAGQASKGDGPAASRPFILRGSPRDAVHRAGSASG